MKSPSSLIGIAATVLALSVAWPTAEPGAAEKRVAGPNGGRIVQGPAGVPVEFHVGMDRIARIRALGADRQPVGAGTLTASLKILKPAAMIAFTSSGSGRTAHLVSTAALPAGDPYPVILTLRVGKKPANVRFTINLETCGECHLAEYACICGH